MSIEIESTIKITIGNQVITLTGEEAKELQIKLGLLLMAPQTVYTPVPTWGELTRITCTTNSSGGSFGISTPTQLG